MKNKKDIFKDSLKALQNHLNNMTEADKQEMREYFVDKTPKGWVSIEEHLPMMLAMDIMQGYSVYKVKNDKGEEFESAVSDHNTWYYRAKECGVTHWFNK